MTRRWLQTTIRERQQEQERWPHERQQEIQRRGIVQVLWRVRPDSHGTGRIFYRLKIRGIRGFTRNHAKRTKI